MQQRLARIVLLLVLVCVLTPGVTVEAASPAIIEKVRTATTDDQGRFRIEALRPGAYKVTFSLTGFSTVVREGIDLPSAVSTASAATNA